MEIGTQIMYVPRHVNSKLPFEELVKITGVELGFVTSVQGKSCHWARYWLPGRPGHLRTVGGSQLTPNDCIIEYKSVDQKVVSETIKRIKSFTGEI